MDQKYGEFVGVDKVYTFDVLVDDEGNYTASTPEYLAPAASIAGEPEVANKTTYYDNKAGNNYVTEGMTALTLIVSNVPAEKMANHLGKHYASASGRVYDTGEANPPSKGIMFRYNMGTNGYRYYCYLKGTFSGGTEEAESKTNDVNEKTYQMIYTAIPTTFEWTIGGVLKPLKRVFGDTSDPAFNAAGWFNQAQTPTTETAPTAIALSTTVPADGATAVVKTAPIVLTFNNKIASETISIINTTTGDPVTVTRSYDTAGKVLTLTPASALAGTTKYVVVVSGVVDIYGQLLTTVGKDFTTAA